MPCAATKLAPPKIGLPGTAESSAKTGNHTPRQRHDRREQSGEQQDSRLDIRVYPWLQSPDFQTKTVAQGVAPHPSRRNLWSIQCL
ncbi:MAG: hypothetical protein ABUS49_09255, partial [Acidobacteriota bacterium]